MTECLEGGVHLGTPSIGSASELDEDGRHDGIELRARARLDLVERGFVIERAAIRPRRRHRVVRIGDGQDPRLERNRVAGPAGRIALSVPALVVVEDVWDRKAELRQAREHPHARRRMTPYLLELAVVEPARLVPHLVGDGELADVVQPRTEPEPPDPLRAPAQPNRDRLAQRAHARAVTAHVRTRVDRFTQTGENRHGSLTSSRGADSLPQVSLSARSIRRRQSCIATMPATSRPTMAAPAIRP